MSTVFTVLFCAIADGLLLLLLPLPPPFRYDIEVRYQDYLGNTEAKATSANVLFDAFAAAIVVLRPASGDTVPFRLPLNFTLPERARTDGVRLSLIYSSGTTDPTPQREVTFGGRFEAQGTHAVEVGSLLEPGDDSDITVTEGGGTDLVNGAVYVLSFGYTDAAGNEAEETAFAVEFDNATMTPILHLPSEGQTVPEDFSVQFTLPEVALPESVMLVFTPFDGNPDPDGKRFIVYGPAFETPGYHEQQMETLATAAENIENVLRICSQSVETCGPPVNLNNGTLYTVTMTYRDIAGNDPGHMSVLRIFHDSRTSAPVIEAPDPAPGATLWVPGTFTLTYLLPEMASPGTVKLTFVSPGPDAYPVADPAPNRVVTFKGDFERNDIGRHNIAINGASLSTLAADHAATVAGVAPAVDLVDGGIYTLHLEYSDHHGNRPANDTVFSVTYAAFDTLAPVFHAPAADTSVDTSHLVDFELPERSAAGTVKLVWTLDAGVTNGVADPDSPHVVTLVDEDGADGAPAGRRQFVLGNLSAAAAELPATVASVSPAGKDLVNGAVYTLHVEYQDGASNPKAATPHARVTFAGSSTLTPTLTHPATDEAVPEDFDAQFTLPENALAGSVRLVWTHTGVGVAHPDGVTAHTVTFSDAHAFRGDHSIRMTALGTAHQLSSVEGVSPQGVDLVDGGVYSVSLEYRDAAGHAVARAKRRQGRRRRRQGAAAAVRCEM